MKFKIIIIVLIIYQIIKNLFFKTKEHLQLSKIGAAITDTLTDKKIGAQFGDTWKTFSKNQQELLSFRIRSKSLDKLDIDPTIKMNTKLQFKTMQSDLVKDMSSDRLKSVEQLLKKTELKLDNYAENTLKQNNAFLKTLKQEKNLIQTQLARLSDFGDEAVDVVPVKRVLNAEELKKLGLPAPPPGFKAPEYTDEGIKRMLKTKNVRDQLIENNLNLVLVKDSSKELNDFSKDLKKMNIMFENPVIERSIKINGKIIKIKRKVDKYIPGIQNLIEKNKKSSLIIENKKLKNQLIQKRIKILGLKDNPKTKKMLNKLIDNELKIKKKNKNLFEKITNKLSGVKKKFSKKFNSLSEKYEEFRVPLINYLQTQADDDILYAIKNSRKSKKTLQTIKNISLSTLEKNKTLKALIKKFGIGIVSLIGASVGIGIAIDQTGEKTPTNAEEPTAIEKFANTNNSNNRYSVDNLSDEKINLIIDTINEDPDIDISELLGYSNDILNLPIETIKNNIQDEGTIALITTIKDYYESLNSRKQDIFMNLNDKERIKYMINDFLKSEGLSVKNVGGELVIKKIKKKKKNNSQLLLTILIPGVVLFIVLFLFLIS